MTAAPALDRRPGWQFRLVRDRAGLSPSARLAGFVLGTYRNNATGMAWPSVETVMAGSGLSRRAVQRALRELEAAGIIKLAERSRYGRGYQFEGRHGGASEPRHTGAPETARGAPIQTLRGATDDAEGRHGDALTIEGTIDGTMGGNLAVSPAAAKSRKSSEPFPCPAGVDPQHWRDLRANRRRKRLADTPTAHKRLTDDLARLADDEWPPGRLVEFAAARGWGGIYDPRTNADHDRNPRNPASKSTANAAAAALAILSAARH